MQLYYQCKIYSCKLCAEHLINYIPSIINNWDFKMQREKSNQKLERKKG